MSRDIKDLTPETQALYYSFDLEMKAAGIDYIVTCTLRTKAEQEALYAQGRTKPGNIVTWTLNSRHLKGTAFDVVIMENGKPDWRVSNQKWAKMGEIAKMLGLLWGGYWKTPDYPHLELKED